jgi:hypothetical protein
VIEAIINASYQSLVRSNSEPAQTALRALSVSHREDKEIVGLKAKYEALDPSTHGKCQAAVFSVLRASLSGTAVALFKALVAAIDGRPELSAKVPGDASDLIIDYVAKVATLWRENKLPASRVNYPENPNCKSSLHRFVELVLTAVIEPSSNRHTADIDEIARQLRASHAQLPPEIRSKIGSGLRREDREWLVSDHHVRKALGLLTLKTGQDTP